MVVYVINSVAQENNDPEYPFIDMYFTTAVSNPWVLHPEESSGEHLVHENIFEEQSHKVCDFDTDFYCQTWYLQFETDNVCSFGVREIMTKFQALYYDEDRPAEITMPFQLQGSSSWDCADNVGSVGITTLILLANHAAASDEDFLSPAEVAEVALDQELYVRLALLAEDVVVEAVDVADIHILTSSVPPTDICEGSCFDAVDFEIIDQVADGLTLSMNLPREIFREALTYVVQIVLEAIVDGESQPMFESFSITMGQAGFRADEPSTTTETPASTLLTLTAGEYSISYDQTFDMDYSQVDCTSAISIIRAANAMALSLEMESVQVTGSCDEASTEATFTIRVNDIAAEDANSLASTPVDQVQTVVLEMLPASVHITSMTPIEVNSPSSSSNSSVSTGSAGIILIAVAAAFFVFVAGAYIAFRRKSRLEEDPVEVVSQ